MSVVPPLERFTALGDSECDRCFQDILDGEFAGRLDDMVICSCCADDLEDGIARIGGGNE